LNNSVSTLTPEDFHNFSQTMSLIYGRLWDKQFETEKGQANLKAIQLWMVSLVQRGITKEDLQRAASKTLDKHLNFPPRLPQVIEMCRLTEEDLGLPPIEQAYYQATSGRLSHRPKAGNSLVTPEQRYWSWAKQTHLAIYHATRLILPDLYTFDRVPSQDSFKMFKTAWEKVICRLLRGEQLEAVPEVLEHQSGLPETEKKVPFKATKAYAEAKKQGLIS
jgi:hypothetical protein